MSTPTSSELPPSRRRWIRWPTPRPARDPRVTALRRFALSITVFTVAGHWLLGFEQSYLTPLVALATAYLLELLLEAVESRVRGRRARYHGTLGEFINFLLPSHIAALACAMLLYGNERLWPTVFAVTVAVASKYVIRVSINGRVRHVLNPSNFGISVTLVLFSTSVAIAPPYHFTEHVTGALNWLIPLGVLVAGTMLNAGLTGRMPLILGWVGGFIAHAVSRAGVVAHSLIAALLPMTGVAFILFTNYMITDPSTTPTAPRRQVWFGLATAAVYGLLVTMHIAFGLFFALTLVCFGRLGILLAVRLRQAVPHMRQAFPVPDRYLPERVAGVPATAGASGAALAPRPTRPRVLAPNRSRTS